MNSDVNQKKAELRKTLKSSRNNISEESYNEAATKISQIDLTPLNISSETIIAGYYPIRKECNCLPLLEKLHNENITIALPVIHGDDLPLTFKKWNPTDHLQKGPLNIPEPDRNAPDINPDILLIPLLAFDNNGNRLGYGKGHYDRTLANIKRVKPITIIGIAYEFQKVPNVPCDQYDQKLDWILTPSGLRQIEKYS